MFPQFIRAGAAWLRSHQDWGETFTEWRLFEASRAAFNFMDKKLGCWEAFQAEMGENCDYANPKLSNSIVLQCMVHVVQNILTAIWDGMADQDLQMVVLECCKLCVSCLH